MFYLIFLYLPYPFMTLALRLPTQKTNRRNHFVALCSLLTKANPQCKRVGMKMDVTGNFIRLHEGLGEGACLIHCTFIPKSSLFVPFLGDLLLRLCLSSSSCLNFMLKPAGFKFKIQVTRTGLSSPSHQHLLVT